MYRPKQGDQREGLLQASSGEEGFGQIGRSLNRWVNLNCLIAPIEIGGNLADCN